MLLTHVRAQRQAKATRRAAFTLLEVLIVVAILVILAGSASIAVFKYLEDAKVGRAKADMRQIEQAIQKMYMESGGTNWPQNGDPGVASNLTQGQAGMISPWQTPYQWSIMPVNNPDGSQGERPVITCQYPKGQLMWPER
jgi:general secretion pathway protein G